MKEKIKKAFKGVTHDLVFAWVFIAMFVYVLRESICEASYVGVIVGLPFLLIAMQAFDLHKKEKELQEAKRIAVATSIAGLHVLKDVERYRELYGELPKETPESEKQNSEEPNESDK